MFIGELLRGRRVWFCADHHLLGQLQSRLGNPAEVRHAQGPASPEDHLYPGSSEERKETETVVLSAEFVTSHLDVSSSKKITLLLFHFKKTHKKLLYEVHAKLIMADNIL